MVDGGSSSGALPRLSPVEDWPSLAGCFQVAQQNRTNHDAFLMLLPSEPRRSQGWAYYSISYYRTRL